MNIYTRLKQCLNIDDFYSILDSANDSNTFTNLKDELEAVDLYEDLLLEIESVQCKEIANEILRDLFNIQDILHEYNLLNIIEVSIRIINEKLGGLQYCDDIILKRIRILEKNAPKCTKCEQRLIVREGKGTYFWGCRDFPDCWGKRYFTTEQNEWIYKGIEMSINHDPPATGEVTAIKEKTTIEEYKEIIQLLADGINPFTGEVFEHTHICQNANVVRALIASAKALEKEISKKIPEDSLVTDGPLVEALKIWRLKKAKELGWTPAYVLHDKVLYRIATVEPYDQNELLAVNGIGKSKLERFSSELIKLIQDVSENIKKS